MPKRTFQPLEMQNAPVRRAVPAKVGPADEDEVLRLQRKAGNRAVVSLHERGMPLSVGRWPWSKKKRAKVSAPTGGHTMTPAEQGGVKSNAEMVRDKELEDSRAPKRRMALTHGSSGAITDESVEGLAAMYDLGLWGFVRDLVDTRTCNIAALQEPCAKAGKAQRDEVYADKNLMARVEKALPVRDYIKFLGYLQVVEQPTTGKLEESGGRKGGHTTADRADQLIQSKLREYVGDAVKAGKKVAGQIAIVSDADFRKAYLDEYGPDDDEVDETNAFVRTRDGDGLIVVHQDRGNAGTTIHEGMHKYSSSAGYTNFHFNEGVTEFFTRQITDNLPKPIARGNYQSEYRLIRKLVALIGGDTTGKEILAKSYFNGQIGNLRKAYLATGHTADDWDDMVAAFAAKRWNRASSLLAPVTGPTTPQAPGTSSSSPSSPTSGSTGGTK